MSCLPTVTEITKISNLKGQKSIFGLKDQSTDLECSPDFVDKEWPAVITAVLQSHSLHFIPHSVDDIFKFIICEQVGDFTRSQQVIDQHQEFLVGNLSVRHQENYSHIL